MLEILETIGGAMVAFITSLVQTITSGFSQMFWTSVGEQRSLSDLAIFLLVIFGIGISVAASKLIFNLIKNR